MRSKIPDKWLYFPIISLGIYFIIRLVDQSKLIYTFPLDFTNDISSYMAQLFFLVQCGFHKLCPYWYNGFINFQFNQPGWYFFTLPIYLLTKSVTAATYISLILTLIIGFLIIYFFGKLHRFSVLSRIAFFLFFLANAVSIGNFIRLGRVHELFAWIIFMVVAFTVLWYKNHKVNKKILLLIPIYSIVILSHQVVTIFTSLFLFSLFLVRKRIKERLLIILSIISSLIITAFWWIPYVRGFSKTYSSNIIKSNLLFSFDKAHLPENILSFLVPLLLIVVFYFYLVSSNKSKKELIFFLPSLILSALLFFRIIAFLPILKHTYTDLYVTYFSFLIIFMFLKMDFNILTKKFKNLIFLGLIFVSVLSIFVSVIYTPFFVSHTDLERETISLFPYVEGKFLHYGHLPTSYSKAYYSYAPIYYNLSTPHGWYYEVKEKEYIEYLFKLYGYMENNDCDKILKFVEHFNATSIITYDDYCDMLESCGLNRKIKKERACLMIRK